MWLSAVAALLLAGAGIAYQYANYREEARVQEFLNDVRAGRYEDAFSRWDSNGKYDLDDFLEDWGSEGVYTKGANETRIVDSHGSGSMVIVQISIDKFNKPLALRVHKETLKLSYAPATR
jgi:hypothetical protein